MTQLALDRYRTLGRTGLRVSPLALGTMTFGTEWGWGADRATAERLVDRYLDAGGNVFDAADLYTGGTAETWLGQLLAARGARDRAVIATKYGYNGAPGDPNAGGAGAKNLRRALEGSLRRLGTDYVDLLLLHTWDRVTPVEEVWRALDDVVAAGKVRYVGLSNVPAWYAARGLTLAEHRGWPPLAALQFEYSLAERGIEHEFVPFALAHGVGLMAWSPLASGLLSGKYRLDEGGGSGEGRLETMKGATNPVFAKFTPRNRRIVAELQAVAAELGCTMAQAALAWLAERPGLATIIVGATRPEQLQENLEALAVALPETLRARLDEASAPERPFPYSFFSGEIQEMVHGAAVEGGTV